MFWFPQEREHRQQSQGFNQSCVGTTQPFASAHAMAEVELPDIGEDDLAEVYPSQAVGVGSAGDRGVDHISLPSGSDSGGMMA